MKQRQLKSNKLGHAVKMEVNQGVMDYVKVAEGFACAAERVFKPEEIAGALARAAKSKTPYVIDIVCELETDCSMGLAVDSVREFV